jgi:hypothetical protein
MRLDMAYSGLKLLDDLLFDYAPARKRTAAAIFSSLVLVFLFVAGILHWGLFLDFGEGSARLDWPERLFSFSVLRESITNFEIPYIVPHEFYFSDRFMGNLQAPFSPQILLTAFMGLSKFILVDTLLMYSLGFLGCLLIKKRYQLSLIPFTILFLLFNFNGHITAHLAVGHPWNGYFLLPFFVLLILELAKYDRADKFGPSILLSFVLFGVLLQGSFHIFFWCLGFLAILGLFNREITRLVAFTILSTISLSLFRLLPAMFFYGGSERSYASGFPSFPIFIDALTTIKTFTFEHPASALYWPSGNPSDPLSAVYDVGWWELDAFIGYVGLGFIAFFGIYHRFSNDPNLSRLRFPALDVPILLLGLFSFGIVFDLVSDLRIPFVSWVERAPSRFFVIPLVVLAALAAIRMQEFLPRLRKSATLKILTVAAVVQLAYSLAAHSWFWRLDSGSAVGRSYGVYEFIAPGQQDGLYNAAVIISAPLSLLALIALCLMYYWKVVRTTG